MMTIGTAIPGEDLGMVQFCIGVSLDPQLLQRRKCHRLGRWHSRRKLGQRNHPICPSGLHGRVGQAHPPSEKGLSPTYVS